MIAPCSTCKKTIERQDSWMKGKRHFCNKECHVKFQATLKGEATNNWRGGAYKFICKYCSQPCEKRRNPIKPKYCSLTCATKDKAQGSKGEKHPNWKERYDSRYLRKIAPRPMPENCEICDTPGASFKKGLCLDHNHKTRKFRGWICTNCNAAIGFSKESVLILKKLIKYIEASENLL